MPTGTDFIADYGQPSEFVLVQLSVIGAITVSVSDDVNEAEFVAVAIPMAVVVADDDIGAEAVTVALNTLFVLVADDDVGVDTATVAIPMRVVVADDEAEIDTAAVVLIDPPIQIVVFDDNTFPPLEPPPMPMTGIARDYVDVEEGVAMGLGIPVLVTDDVAETDEVLIGLGLPVFAVDTVVVLDVIDADAVTINPVLVGFDQVVQDTVTPIDVVTVVRVVVIDVADVQTPTDAVVAALPMTVDVADAAGPDEGVEVRAALTIAVWDDAPSSELVDALASVLLPAVADTVPIEDVAGGAIPMRCDVFDAAIAIDQETAERVYVTSQLHTQLHFINDTLVATSVANERVVVTDVADERLRRKYR